MEQRQNQNLPIVEMPKREVQNIVVSKIRKG